MSTAPCGDWSGPINPTTESLDTKVFDGFGRDVRPIGGALIEYVKNELLATHAALAVRLVDGQLDCVYKRGTQVRARAGQGQLCGDRPWAGRKATGTALQQPTGTEREQGHEGYREAGSHEGSQPHPSRSCLLLGTGIHWGGNPETITCPKVALGGLSSLERQPDVRRQAADFVGQEHGAWWSGCCESRSLYVALGSAKAAAGHKPTGNRHCPCLVTSGCHTQQSACRVDCRRGSWTNTEVTVAF